MQQGDMHPPPPPPEERNATLDARYREEGWGLITDAVFQGRIAPTDVESQAREVARWAYQAQKEGTAAFNDRGQQLVEQDAQISQLQAVAGAHARLVPKYQGTRAALQLLRVENKRLAVEVARANADAASARLKLAEAELVLAEAASRRGDHHMPTSVEARVLRNWLDENREEDADG